ncbi:MULTISPECIES: penicillin-binding protein 2 [Gordonibacter]|uniref:Penicillin-binding protein 2 n=1 Tax=Gordonibacter faecis TaxID=3047475 RepID=A0ABT7DP77_9ACTN|nr:MULTISPECIES: penicillin-binding protein 2 [unclassified Gordonibacter]MDJ1651032.1 penicillin-binding protein 2 [Gordonibacter sp. KGMB12511]HIW77269.1 penicillin-binding protein 2 [Candidatus Gordonibacter avicola]
MVAALIAAAITLVVALVVIVVVFAVRNRTKTPYAGQKKKDVRSVGNVGVSSSLGAGGKHGGGGSSAPRVSSSQPASKKPADGLKSRFAAIGVLAAAIFGSLSVKLWSMQVMSSEYYAGLSAENKYTVVPTPAPRGCIYDADGVALVKNRSMLTVLADADVASDRDVVQRLSTVLGLPYNVVRQRIQDATSGAQSQRVVVSDARLRDVAFISEHADAFKGVSVETRTVREYPFGALAAHVVGYTGAVNEKNLASASNGRTIELGDSVGQAGVEYVYDDLLAGDHGQRTVIADADGNVVEVESETQPTRGSDVTLTIKAPVQYVCDRALAALIAPENGTIGTGKGCAGAVVVMDVRDGGIAALASYPTFEPGLLTGSISNEVWDTYDSDESYHPLLDRVVQGEYPAASTFKAFTGLAALKYGFAGGGRTWDCGGSWDGWHTGVEQKCWNHSGHGILDFRGGIVNSCDVVFYDIAKSFFDASVLGGNAHPTVSDTAMQDEVEKYGFGKKTGIDLPGETVGRIPTPEWKAERWRDVPAEIPWKGGDSTNMVIGQGDVLVTPLQVAVAYGAIATGKLMKPHVLKEVRNASGAVAATVEPEVVGEPDVDQANLNIVRDALRGVGTENAELVALFNQFGLDPATVACKTGTGEKAGQEDYAWFACYAPYDDPKYVVACVVEQGGGGSAVGAPLGIEVLAAALKCDAGELTEVAPVAGSTGKSQPLATSGSSGRTD